MGARVEAAESIAGPGSVAFIDSEKPGSLPEQIRRAQWCLQSVRIQQTARNAFDLTRLGAGSAERLCSALILGAAFFFVVNLLAQLAKF